MSSSVPAESVGASGSDRAARGRSRRRFTAAGVAAVLVAGAAFAFTRLTPGPGSHPAVNPTATITATVQRTDLAQTTPVNGTVGFASPLPGRPTPVSIVQPGGSPPAVLNQAQQAVASAQQILAADQQAADDTKAADTQAVAQAQQLLSTTQATLAADEQREAANAAGVASGQTTVSADQQKVASDQVAVSSAQSQLTSARLKVAQNSNQNQAKLNADQLNLSKARSAAADAQTSETAYDQSSKYTALPVAGQVIAPGQPLWSVDGQAVVLLPGTLSPWRAFTLGLTPGPDVAALNQALIDMGGNGLRVSDTFTSATAAAIDRLQGSLGLPQTGSFPLGSVMFAPTALRVTAVHPQIGSLVSAGAAVLDVTSTTPIVNVALPVDESYLVKVGDPVTVRLPDGTTTNGTITAVGTVATNSTPSSGSSSNSPSATVNVTVTMPHATGAASLDQAPVTVNITNRTATNVLAVLTTALLPLAGGGYAVEVVAADGTHHLAPVTTGIFDDQAGMVEVSGAGLAAGQKVVAAA